METNKRNKLFDDDDEEETQGITPIPFSLDSPSFRIQPLDEAGRV